MQTRPYRTEFPYNLLDVISFQARRSTEYIETVPATFERDYTQLITKLFTERQCAVLNARYRNNASYKSIAQELGVSLPRVGQILEHMCRILAQDENWNILTGKTSTCKTCCSTRDASSSDLNTQLVKASCIYLNSIALGIPSNIVERLNVVGIIYLADLLLCSGYDLSCTPGITSDISSLLVKKLEQLGCSAAHLGSVSNKASPYESCPYASQVLSPESGIVEFAVRKRLSTIADFPARVRTVLTSLGIFTVAQFLQLSGLEFHSLTSIGARSRYDAAVSIERLGYCCAHLLEPSNVESPYVLNSRAVGFNAAFTCAQIPLAEAKVYAKRRSFDIAGVNSNVYGKLSGSIEEKDKKKMLCTV